MKTITTSRILCGIISGILIAGSTYAMGPQGGPKHCAHRDVHQLKRLIKQLDLSDSQKAQVQEIMENARDERRASYSKPEGPRSVLSLDPSDPEFQNQAAEIASRKAEKLTQGTIFFTDLYSEVHGVLTPEQQAELKARLEKRREAIKKHHKSMSESEY